ncbi:hypothetical protein Tco_0343788 [Tanacetum coccineum]
MIVFDDEDDCMMNEGPSLDQNRVSQRKKERHDSGVLGSASNSSKDDEQSLKKTTDSDASASKQHPTFTSTGWQITDTRDVVIDSLMHRSEPESGHSEHSSNDTSKQDEGHRTMGKCIRHKVSSSRGEHAAKDDVLYRFLHPNGLHTNRKEDVCNADLEVPAFHLLKLSHKKTSFSFNFEDE